MENEEAWLERPLGKEKVPCEEMELLVGTVTFPEGKEMVDCPLPLLVTGFIPRLDRGMVMLVPGMVMVTWEGSTAVVTRPPSGQ